MSGEVRSLEEVIAAALVPRPTFPTAAGLNEAIAHYETPTPEHIAVAVREWCLAPQQIEAAAREIWEDGYQSCDWEEITDENRRRHYLATARRALQAVMGDTP